MPSSLDQTVKALNLELKQRGVCRPDVLCLMATGTQYLIDHLEAAHEISLGSLEGVPNPWKQATLYSGKLGDLMLWALDDLGNEPAPNAPLDAPPAWAGGLPIWLAAAAGATLCVHSSAGSALDPGVQAGFRVLRDHINLSGASPLLGLGISELGPLFPDQSHVHHLGLRRAALREAEALGLPVQEAIAACTSGPALETPAEQAMLAKLGAEISVQGLAAPLIACAHSGLACLALVSVSAAHCEAADLELLVQQAAEAGPLLNRWILSLLPDLRQAAQARRAQLLT